MSKERTQGFTLIELRIVVAIIAIIASIAVPNLTCCGINANDSAALATLKNLSSAQAHVQASGVIDSNRNGAGEYGYFQELSGARNVRDGSPASGLSIERVRPPVLSGAFGGVDANGRVLRSGYMFQMYLPGVGGAWLAENSLTAAYPAVDGALSEVLWACYAWPSSYGNSGQRAFFVNQTGEVLQSSNSLTRYSGATRPPVPSAALLASASKKSSMQHSVAVNATGTDGMRWTSVQ